MLAAPSATLGAVCGGELGNPDAWAGGRGYGDGAGCRFRGRRGEGTVPCPVGDGVKRGEGRCCGAAVPRSSTRWRGGPSGGVESRAEDVVDALYQSTG